MFQSPKLVAAAFACFIAWLTVVQFGPRFEDRDWPLLLCLVPDVIAVVLLVRLALQLPPGALWRHGYEVTRRSALTLVGSIGLVALSIVAANLVQDLRIYD